MICAKTAGREGIKPLTFPFCHLGQVAFSSRDFTKTILANVKLVVNQEMQEGGYPQVLDAADMALFEVPNEILQAHRDIFWAPLTTGADYIVYVLFAYDARGTATYVGASICAPDDGVGPNDPYREKCHFCRPSNQQSA